MTVIVIIFAILCFVAGFMSRTSPTKYINETANNHSGKRYNSLPSNHSEKRYNNLPSHIKYLIDKEKSEELAKILFQIGFDDHELNFNGLTEIIENRNPELLEEILNIMDNELLWV